MKHRNGSKRIQQFMKYAGKNPEFKKLYEAHIRFGRELAEKHGAEKDSDDEDSKKAEKKSKRLSTAEMLEVRFLTHIKVNCK